MAISGAGLNGSLVQVSEGHSIRPISTGQINLSVDSPARLGIDLTLVDQDGHEVDFANISVPGPNGGVVSGLGHVSTGNGFTLNQLEQALPNIVVTPTDLRNGSDFNDALLITITAEDDPNGFTISAGPGPGPGTPFGVRILTAPDIPTLTAQSVRDTETINPFPAGFVLSDNPDITGGPLDTVRITLSAGTLSGDDVISTGNNTFALAAADPGTLSDELRALTYTPPQVLAGTVQPVNLTVTVTNNAPDPLTTTATEAITVVGTSPTAPAGTPTTPGTTPTTAGTAQVTPETVNITNSIVFLHSGNGSDTNNVGLSANDLATIIPSLAQQIAADLMGGNPMTTSAMVDLANNPAIGAWLDQPSQNVVVMPDSAT